MTNPQSGGFGYSKVLLLRDQLLGNETYGTVCKAQCDDLLCAAKILHPLLVVTEANLRSLEQECQRLCSVRHPNIVQYLGTHADGPNCLAILMELMDRSLTTYLEEGPASSSSSSLPFHTEINLCHDVALALSHLHTNDILHCNLSSNNVLLTRDLRAKVADFGMSRLGASGSSSGGGDPPLSRLSPVRGHSAAYMSPESLADPPTFSKKLDVFSFGVLALQVLTRKFPNPSPPRRKIDNRDYGMMPVEVAVPETERRRDHIELVDPVHPLMRTITLCLAYAEGERPEAQDLCTQTAHLKTSDQYLASMKEESDSMTTTKETLRNRAAIEEGELSRTNEELLSVELLKNDLQMQLVEKEMEVLNAREDKRVAEETVEDLKRKLGVKEEELRVSEWTKKELLGVKEVELKAAEESRKELYGHLRVKDEELRASEDSRKELHGQLRVKEEQVKVLQQSRRELESQLTLTEELLKSSEESKRELQAELWAAHAQMKSVQDENEMLKRRQGAGDQRESVKSDGTPDKLTAGVHVETQVKAVEERKPLETPPPTAPPTAPPTTTPLSPPISSSNVLPRAPPTAPPRPPPRAPPTAPPRAPPTAPPTAQVINDNQSTDSSDGAKMCSPPPPNTSSDPQTIVLDKGPSGSFGIGITGGVDSPLYAGNTGIYITKIVPDGVAGKDGRLRVDDQILSINGTLLENITHMQAVDVMKQAGQCVTMIILRSEGISPGTSKTASSVAHVTSPNSVVNITLQKNAKGEYGFDILGGLDDQYVQGDNGIFITKITPRCPADDNGCLEVADRILEVDGKSLVNVPYDVAVSILNTAQDRMVLKIEKNAIRNPKACVTSEVRSVVLNCPEGHSLGISLFGFDTNTGVYISAITPDSAAARSNLLRIGDQILEVNHNDLRTATLKTAVAALECAGTNVSLLVEYRPDDISDILSRIVHHRTTASTGLVSRPPLKVEQIYVRVLFNYNAEEEEGHTEDVLSFRQGDILHILNGSGEVWWQAAVVNNQGTDTQVGKVPSRKQIISAASRKASRTPTPPRSPRSEKKAAKASKQKPKQKKESAQTLTVEPSANEQSSMDEYMPTYVPVQRGQSGHTHPIIILGPLKDEIIEILVRDFPNDYACCIQHTTRPPKEKEVNGRDYHFVPKDQMERDIQNHLFIEISRHDGYLYGTSPSAVRAVIEQGKYCILGVSGYSISYLQSASLYPVAICVRPDSWNVVRTITHGTEQECQSIIKRGAATEQEFINYISAVVTGNTMSDIYTGVKTVIRDRSGGPVWILTDDLLL